VQKCLVAHNEIPEIDTKLLQISHFAQSCIAITHLSIEKSTFLKVAYELRALLNKIVPMMLRVALGSEDLRAHF